MWALPSDIDHGTRDKKGWRQFPFTQYGRSSTASSFPVGGEYQKVFANSLPRVTELAESDESEWTKSPLIDAEYFVTTFDENQGLTTDQGANEDFAPIETASIRLSEAIGQSLASSMTNAEAVLRICADLDRQVLAMVDALTTIQERRQKNGVLDRGQEFFDGVSERGSWCKISGGSLLKQWHSLYIDEANATAKVLADADLSFPRNFVCQG